MKALSIRQPWAWAILNVGKDVENRDWKPNNPAVSDARKLIASRERFLIHTGLGMTKAEYEDCLETLHAISRRHKFPSGLALPAQRDLPRGGIVGSAVLTAFVDDSPSPFFFGPWGLMLADVKPCRFIEMKGALGFFDVNDERVRLSINAGFI